MLKRPRLNIEEENPSKRTERLIESIKKTISHALEDESRPNTESLAEASYYIHILITHLTGKGPQDVQVEANQGRRLDSPNQGIIENGRDSVHSRSSKKKNKSGDCGC